MAAAAPTRCIRCYTPFTGAPYLMAGRAYCCPSCSVGSACEHQGIRRAMNVRRFDTNFDRFRQAANFSSPYEERQPGDHDEERAGNVRPS